LPSTCFEAKEQDAESAEPAVIPAKGGNGQVIAPTPPEATDLAPANPSGRSLEATTAPRPLSK
jgi:hypothetical protein